MHNDIHEKIQGNGEEFNSEESSNEDCDKITEERKGYSSRSDEEQEVAPIVGYCRFFNA